MIIEMREGELDIGKISFLAVTQIGSQRFPIIIVVKDSFSPSLAFNERLKLHGLNAIRQRSVNRCFGVLA